MEIVDELDTPGCPNCAVKHLSAALAYYLDVPRELRGRAFSDVEVYLARAMINLAETNTGYRSHKWFAVGLMVKAEEISTVVSPILTPAIRTMRTDFMSGDAGVQETVSSLTHFVGTGMPIAAAHLEEAKRELPGCTRDVVLDAECLISAIDRVHEEYFNLTEPAVGEEVNKEGESDMATVKKAPAKKAAAKKEAPKAAAKQAACKGGKCAGKKTAKK